MGLYRRTYGPPVRGRQSRRHRHRHDPRSGETGDFGYPSRQSNDHRCTRAVDDHPRPQGAPVSTPCVVAIWPDDHHHHGTFETFDPAAHSVGNCSASARVTDDTGSQIKQPFQTELYPSLHRRRESRRRRSVDVGYQWFCEHNKCLQFLYCTNGITRQKVIDLCKADGIPVFERNYSLVDTYGADEAFLTGTFGAQTPIGSIDGRIIGTGEMGPMTQHIRSLYKSLIEHEVAK